MAEPWLDSLSEDWNSQPRSSSPAALLPRLVEPSTPVSKSSPGARSKSRIPLPPNGLTSSPAALRRNKSTKSTQLPTPQRRILKDRTSSEINISIRKTQSGDEPKHIRSKSLPPSSSPDSHALSVDIDCLDGSVQRTSPTKGAETNNNSTPEWKKLVLNKQSGVRGQTDLFSQTALESMFDRPPSSDPEPLVKKRTFMPMEDSEAIPSSPPPWPLNHRRASAFSSLTTGARPSQAVLDTLDEHEEEENGTSLEAATVESRGALKNATQNTPGVDVTMNEDIRSDHEGVSWQYDGPADQSKNSVRSHTSKDLVPPYRHASSSTAGGFSPVYITKHNTTDGKVGYKAMDVSDPLVVKQIQDQMRSSNQTQQIDDSSTTQYVQLQASLRSIGEYVETQRGGYSNQGSFRTRPLSPSASSSILPSDSVSQVHVQKNVGNSVQKRQECPESSNSSPERPDKLNTKDAQRVLQDLQKVVDGDDEIESRTDQQNRGVIDLGPTSGIPEDGAILTGSCGKMLKQEQIHTRRSLSPQYQDSRSMKVSSDEQGAKPSLTPRKHIARPCNALRSGGHEVVESAEQKPTFERSNLVGLVRVQHKRMQALLGRRKDARFESACGSSDPSEPLELTEQSIVRPSNPTPGQSTCDHRPDAQLRSDGPHSQKLQADNYSLEESFGQTPLRDVTPEQVQAAATEVVDFRTQLLKGQIGAVRKNSVSTQDYVDEAMKLMEIIRSKRKPPSMLSSIGESNDDLSITPQQIDRPPSREGPSKPWRVKGGLESSQVDPILVDHLQKYAETGDESYLMSSVFYSVRLNERVEDDLEQSRVEDKEEEEEEEEEEADEGQVDVMDHAANIRIRHRENLGEEQERAYTNRGSGRNEGPESPGKTHSSNKSMDSNAKTIESTASQKSRNLTVISPDKVSHLIKDEEAGMKFDPEARTWRKAKKRNAEPEISKGMASSVATDEDPFHSIPDLSINEAEENKSQANVFLQLPSQAAQEPGSDLSSIFQRPEQLSESEFIPNAAPGVQSKSLAPEQSHEQDLESEQYTRSKLLDMSKNASVESDETEEIVFPSPHTRQARRELSVVFSSPPVSRQWEAQAWDSPGNLTIKSPQRSGSREHERLHDDIDSSLILRLPSKSHHFKPHDRVAPGRHKVESQHPNVPLSLSRIDEHHEISFIDQLPSGRTMSLTLSISTPLPAHRRTSVPIIPSSGLRNSKFFNSLSSLSEFTFHQDDAHHLENRCLAQGGNQIAVHDGKPRTALVLSKLVQKLTDVEPDEPYWDWMRSLNLSKKDLNNLHGLDEFCSRLEKLSISENELSQLNGVPSTVRELLVCNNAIGDLTAWNHLTNLQYLDLSGNHLERLEGLGRLVHLRELILDDNQIVSLDGLFDLDGLISLSVRRNQLESVDFHECELKRLERLDVSENHLHTITGLAQLQSLEELDAGSNQLYSFPCGEIHDDELEYMSRLRVLQIANNHLEDLDISTAPNLEVLVADRNRLSRVYGVSNVASLRAVALRSQDETADISTSLDDFCEVQHLFLSGNHMPELQIYQRFYNLQTLELAHSGLQHLPTDFRDLAPNLRTLNLNNNSLKSLKPLRGTSRLERLYVAGNRIERLRKTIAVLGSLQALVELDLRDNHFTLGFWPSPAIAADANTFTLTMTGSQDLAKLSTTSADTFLSRIDSVNDAEHMMRDRVYYERLDEETKLKRRVYELLLASKCPRLKFADHLPFDRSHLGRKDGTWDRLVELGIVEESVIKVREDGQTLPSSSVS